jgi:hypothetical protein
MKQHNSNKKILRTAVIILLSIAGLCFSESSNALQFLPVINAAATVPPTTTPSTTTPDSSSSTIEQLNIKMAQISSSDKPEDIATLAYIWGFPLVTMERQFNFVTSPNVPPGVGRGPANTISSHSCAHELINASFTDVVSPNADNLYCFVQIDLKNEPVVLVIPPISSDRYNVFQFLDAYTNNFAYLGTRATGSTNGNSAILALNSIWKYIALSFCFCMD